MTKTTKDTLHLVLKKKWYDMIASGEKKEEYRDISTYYQKRLLVEPTRVTLSGDLVLKFKPYKQVCFHLGYTNTTMTFKIAGFDYDRGKEEWGALPCHIYFIIKLGERVK